MSCKAGTTAGESRVSLGLIVGECVDGFKPSSVVLAELDELVALMEANEFKSAGLAELVELADLADLAASSRSNLALMSGI